MHQAHSSGSRAPDPGFSRFFARAGTLAAVAGLSLEAGFAGPVDGFDPAPEPLAAIGSDTGADAELLETVQSLSLEELLNPEISLASRRPQALFDSAAASFVISNEDIRRSGSRSIPEALRLAPGISVGRIDSNKWAISSRGFSDRSADKLLVMIDGRTVYSPAFSGVFWDAQNYLMEDIDRIEVIRGPGGALWGANAVNGVINIVTKDSARTRGGYVTGGVGDDGEWSAGGRFGGSMGETGHFRGYLDAFSRDGTAAVNDDWDNVQGGFRMDWALPDSHITLQGDAYRGHREQVQTTAGLSPVTGSFPPTYLRTGQHDFDIYGANLLFNYNRELDNGSTVEIQAYYDYTERRDSVFDGYGHIFDTEFQHSFALGQRNSIVWGLGYRALPDKFRNPDPDLIVWDPAETNHQLFSGFIQDEIELVEDRLKFIIGTKVEHNDYTGWEFQPTARFTFKPAENQTLWGAVSRAVQVPQRNFEAVTYSLAPVEPSPVPIDANGDGVPDTTLPLFVVGQGIDPDNRQIVDPTELFGYELGYRIQPTNNLTVDTALFYNRYYDAIGPEFRGPLLEPGPPTRLEFYSLADNDYDATSYGGEISVQWVATDWWRIGGYYSYINIDFPENAGLFNAGKDPENQFSLRSSWDLPLDLEFDLWWRYVDRLSSFDIDSYHDLDLRLAWRPTESLEIALVAHNLIEPSRYEFSGEAGSPVSIPRTSIERGIYLQTSFRF